MIIQDNDLYANIGRMTNKTEEPYEIYKNAINILHLFYFNGCVFTKSAKPKPKQ